MQTDARDKGAGESLKAGLCLESVWSRVFKCAFDGV